VYRRGDLSLTDGASRWLQRLPWPGNIRQLKHLIERTVLMCVKDRIDVEDFELPMEMEARESPRDALPAAGAMTLDEIEKNMIVKCLERFGGNLSKSADALGLSRPALYRRLEKYGLTP
jgi:two-component system NtrC family response regulator